MSRTNCDAFLVKYKQFPLTESDYQLTNSPQIKWIITYKKRWTIETFYNYFKNKADFNTLYEGDYYKTQGLAFIMLVVGLIQRAMETAVINVNGKSVSTCLLDARMVKISKRQGVWTICNVLNKQKTLFEKLNTPLTVFNQQHT